MEKTEEKTTQQLIELKNKAQEIEHLQEDEAVFQLIIYNGKLYSFIKGNLFTVQDSIEFVYQSFPETKDVINDIAKENSVLEEHLKKPTDNNC
ncbi:MAG TPA: hypothetical protein PLS84_03175 [Salinivirgaceae bacterium]|nr:hypothetical protein [Salinivirgaceae bacterium]